MTRIIRQWVDLTDWSSIAYMLENGWEMAEESDNLALMIKEI